MLGKPSLLRCSAARALFTICIITLLIVCDLSNALLSSSIIKSSTNLKQTHPTVQHQQYLPRFELSSISSSTTTTSLQLLYDPTHDDNLANDNTDAAGHGISLIEDENNDYNNRQSPVRKRISSEGTGNSPSEEEDSIVEIRYTGTLLGERHYWSASDVVQCWLSQLQGLENLAPKFIEHNIDGGKLMDESYFTEQFCKETLGMESKIQAKKFLMAARRLTRQQVEYPSGTVFDSSGAGEGTIHNYTFVLKAKKQGRRSKVIPAMELAVRSMKVGERPKVICRSDYAYGSEGLRSSKGEVIVPPFAMLCFDLTLVNSN